MEHFQAKYRNATDTELTEAFTHAIPELSLESESDIYIVIDGIDECPDPANLCEQFLQIARDQVRVLVTSRSGLRDIDKYSKANHTFYLPRNNQVETSLFI